MEWFFCKINASFHHSLKVKHIFIKEKYWMYYLPQYSPDLAPVELAFSTMKHKLRSYLWGHGWNFNTKKGWDVIVKSCADMSKIHLKYVDGGHQECERVHFEESDEPELSQRLIISEFNLTQLQILKYKNTLAKFVSNLILLNIVRNNHKSNEKLGFNRSKRVHQKVFWTIIWKYKLNSSSFLIICQILDTDSSG